MAAPTCLDLDDPRARDPAIAGAKAAGLATARAAGLPVLPGVVVPVAHAEPVVQAAAAAIDRGDARGARLAVMAIGPSAELLAEVTAHAHALPRPLIVRSSSPLECDGRWSGAFSTFHGVATDELGAAIRGCWGSGFSVGVLDRAVHTGTAIARLGLAVLVQPELSPDLGGVARLCPDGAVRISATRGPLRPLMRGDVEGETTLIRPGSQLDAADGHLAEVAALVHRTAALLGHRSIEWAAVGSDVYLLQSLRTTDDPVDRTTGTSDPALAADTALRVAALVQRFPGRLAEELVLPWAVAAGPLPSPRPAPGPDPVRHLAAARSHASELVALVWGGSPRAAAAAAERTLRQLRGPHPAPALATIDGLAPPPVDRVSAVLGHLDALRRETLRRGLVDEDERFWRLDPDVLEGALRSGAAVAESRLGVGRWEPFTFGVVTAAGRGYAGSAAAAGAGVGRLHLVEREHQTPRGRYVLVAGRPDPSLGPLLWNAAGLVTRAGSPAAHVIEFARSIGVPAVVGCDLPPIDAGGTPPLIAVDGDRGWVSIADVAATG